MVGKSNSTRETSFCCASEAEICEEEDGGGFEDAADAEGGVVLGVRFGEAGDDDEDAATALDSQEKSLETYIVHVEPQSSDVEIWHNSFLPELVPLSERQQPHILYHYRHVISGFAARLSSEDVEFMQQKKGFISARRERILQLLTTHSPNFLGLNPQMGLWNLSNYGKGVIIGLLDTGISADHPSYSGEGMPPPPAKWKGKCELSSNLCNNKLIGARNFVDGTVMDELGHGSHTSSIAAGNFVPGANILGSANGTAAGVAPLAHLAMYKVCNDEGCNESNVAAGMDAAIEDGVDVLSISIGGDPAAIDEDIMAIGAYRAAAKGIIVNCAAGNNGPFFHSVENAAPWFITVGASTPDRNLSAVAVLGNGVRFYGETAFQPKDLPATKQLPLVSSGSGYWCGSAPNFKGNIVLCYENDGSRSIQNGKEVKKSGGVAMIIGNDERYKYTIMAEANVLPASQISFDDFLKLKSYLESTPNITAKLLFNGTVLGNPRTPVVAGFSARGPSEVTPGILKPDIIAPGVSILGAWHAAIDERVKSKPFFNMMSGTSMACPHVAGVTALLKSLHPDWSPAAIKSAIMTTGYQLNLGGQPILEERFLPANIFAIGSGHVNPLDASDPGLVYDLHPDDYIPYLCGLYTSTGVSNIVQKKVNCSMSIPEAELNYPSFSIVLGQTAMSYSRTVTNVGEANSTYNVVIGAPDGVSIEVSPVVLKFSEIGQKLKYEVKFSTTAIRPKANFTEGFIKWISPKYSVRSPVAVAYK